MAKVGDRVSWSSSGGTARGIIRSIHRDGAVPNIPVKITGTKEEPAARIELVDDEGKPRNQFVGHKMTSLSKYAEVVDKADKPLNKPFRLPKGSSKKFGVYVKSGDKTVKVTFGDPNMEIRRDNPKARANFRSRHSCSTAKDKTSARYWSCRMWSDSSVGSLTKAEEDFKPHTMYNPDTGKGIMVNTYEEHLDLKDKGFSHKMIKNIEGKILKTDDEQRMVYGWASVVTENGEPVVDRQGDVIEAETLVKAVNEFMEHVRVGKAMHVGDQVGTVVHSLPITKEIGDSLGIQSDREGWVVAYKVFDDDVWNMVKSGELAAFSIGGRAIKEEI
jgi:hypothetical protein